MKRCSFRLFFSCVAMIALNLSAQNERTILKEDFESDKNRSGISDFTRFNCAKGEVIPTIKQGRMKDNSFQHFQIKKNGIGKLRILHSKNGISKDFIPVASGSEYILKFYCKTGIMNSLAVKIFAFKNEKWEDALLLENSMFNATQWKKFRTFIKIPEGRKYLAVLIFANGKKGFASIDDFSLNEAKAVRLPEDKTSAATIIALKQRPSTSKQVSHQKGLPLKKGYCVRNNNGVPTIFHNGKPFFANVFFNCTWSSTACVGKLPKEMNNAGVKIHFLGTALDWHKEFASGGVANYGNAYSTLDERIASILKMNPDAKFILNLHCFSPFSWYKKHPNEIMADSKGSIYRSTKKFRSANSWASLKWKTEIIKRIKALMAHIKKQDYYNKILGAVSFAGWEGQWTWWRPLKDQSESKLQFLEQMKSCVDYSPAMLNYLKKWVKNKYKNVEALRKSWKSDEVTFDNVSIPAIEIVSRCDFFGFRDASKGDTRRVVDYFDAFIDARLEALMAFTKVIKNETKDSPILAGAYYGARLWYHIGGNLNSLRELSGYDRKFFKSPDIDFFISPPFHYVHEIGGGTYSHLLADTLMENGKFVFLEHDLPTHLRSHGKHEFNKNDKVPKNLNETIELLKRGLAYVICKGMGVWWWDEQMEKTTGNPGWYNAPEIWNAFKKFSKIGEAALNKDRTQIHEIAVIYSERNCLFTSPTSRGIGHDLILNQFKPFLQMGAPFGVYSVADMDKIPPMKVYIFWNTFYMTKEQRDYINANLKKNGSTLVWIYAPGFLSDEGLYLKTMSDLIGFNCQKIDDLSKMASQITNKEHPISKTLYKSLEGQIFKPVAIPEIRRALTRQQEEDVAPLFYVNDLQATTLGRYKESGLPSLAVKNFDNWRSVYCGFYPLSAELLRNIAQYSGAHIYNTQKDVIYANKSYIGFHSAKPGKHKIYLPKSKKVTELFSGAKWDAKSKSFSFETDGPATKLFLLE